MPSKTAIKAAVLAVVAVAVLTRIDATRELVIGNDSWF